MLLTVLFSLLYVTYYLSDYIIKPKLNWYLFIQFSGCNFKLHHSAVSSFFSTYLHDRGELKQWMERVEKFRRKKNPPKFHMVSDVELTVMLPFPAGLLSFITSGLVSFLEETIWAKKNKKQ